MFISFQLLCSGDGQMARLIENLESAGDDVTAVDPDIVEIAGVREVIAMLFGVSIIVLRVRIAPPARPEHSAPVISRVSDPLED